MDAIKALFLELVFIFHDWLLPIMDQCLISEHAPQCARWQFFLYKMLDHLTLTSHPLPR